MAYFKFSGSDLYASSHKVATIDGNKIYDEHHHQVATIKGNEIYDEHNHKVATVKGTDIYDEHYSKIATMNDVKKSIDGAIGGTSIVGLWWFFVK